MTNSRRSNGTGSITLRRGRYLARLRIEGRLRTIGTYDSFDEAERVLSAAATKLASPNCVVMTGETLRAVGERFLDQRELDRYRNIVADRSRFRTHIASTWLAQMPVRAITPRDVRNWLKEARKSDTSDRRKKRKISLGTVRHCLNLLRGCFEFAITDKIIEENPAIGIRLPEGEDTGDAWTYLTMAEQAAIRSCQAIPEPDCLRVLFGLFTGVRQREQWCLQLPDVHLNDPSGPHVVIRYGAPGRTTKSKKIRRVPLIPEAVQLVKRWRSILPSYAPKNPHNLLWPTPRGCRRQRSKTYGFKKHLKAAGITRNVRWHDLRHTCASSLVAGWWGKAWSLQEVRDLLGHSSVEVTERYAHLASSVVQRAANATTGIATDYLRSKRDPIASKLLKQLTIPSHSGAKGRRFESCVARKDLQGEALKVFARLEADFDPRCRGPASWSCTPRATVLAQRGAREACSQSCVARQSLDAKASGLWRFRERTSTRGVEVSSASNRLRRARQERLARGQPVHRHRS